ncbi:MAG: AAA family ATPase [Paludibacteraceae bacterium]|nr:AAA family ATPase [Paludibacteraceae bacterium]
MAQHISVRVPWHDNNWNGSVCSEPSHNNSCLRLSNISENKSDANEQSLCGKCMRGIEDQMCCIGEGAAFMSDIDLYKTTKHPYIYSSPSTHGHFTDTTIKYPKYSLPARPFAWMMKEKDNRPNLQFLIDRYGINYQESREPRLSWHTIWVQEAENQQAIFDTFYGDIVPHQSLVIAYAKQVPFIEDQRRVIIGMGHITAVDHVVEHQRNNDKGTLRSLTWETPIHHSIRPDHKDGFIIPYKEMMEYAESHPDFDLSSITVFAPDDAFEEFSYATEHVSHDSIIEVLLSCIKAFQIIDSCIGGYSNVIEWLNRQLSEVWEDRGAFPGLGPMLSAFNVPLGMLIGKELNEKSKEKNNIWELVDEAFSNPQKILSSKLASQIKPILSNAWNKLGSERKQLFKLLSRFALTVDHAIILYNEEERERSRIEFSDKEIIENPYILYEKTRLIGGLMSVQKVDRAIFPIPSIAEKYPMEAPSALSSDNDERRIRALAISILEKEALDGNTIMPCKKLVLEMKDMSLDPACNVNADIIHSIESFMSPEVLKREMKDGSEYYKLVRIQEFDNETEKRIKKRLDSDPIDYNENWATVLNQKFKSPTTEKQIRGRSEQIAILDILAKSRLSVLVGEAGTGKTTLLSILCGMPKIKASGVLLLAPTGKATVRLMESMKSQNGSNAMDGVHAMNVAQFLAGCDGYDGDFFRYILPSVASPLSKNKTVIIDEASMLTEEMMGSLIKALSNATRIIFVGDPNQLPPIGAGRPFVDLVNLLRLDLKPGTFPKITKHYGELTINHRQEDNKDIMERKDVFLSKIFTSSLEIPDNDVITDILLKGSPNIEFHKWACKEDLEPLILNVMSKELGMKDINDQDNFDIKLGGTISEYGTFFNKEASKAIESWQILAPVRNMPQGVMNINRLIHLKYREKYIKVANYTKKSWKKIAAPLGPEGIVYGDKVINVVNNGRKAFPDDGRNYVANGEIGLACGTGEYRTNRPDNYRYTHIEYATQPGYSYSYESRDFDSEKGNNMLELAYALTVHKSQGSQFNTVILVIAEPCRIISKEMLYTALTRQTDKIIILYNNDASELLKYSSPSFSAISTRFTDLFRDVFKDYKPQIVEVNGKFYDDKLINRTASGIMVRSKSEVVIADALYHNGVEFEYEAKLTLDGHDKYPDFTIEDNESGKRWYWEHCGMMNDPHYKQRWEEKKKFYEKHGIKEGVNLIVTYDDENGSIDSAVIEQIIKDHF